MTKKENKVRRKPCELVPDLDFGRRTIVKQGGSFMISLPAPWVREVVAEKVEITMGADKTLQIVPLTSIGAKKAEKRGDLV